jgi:hypothetical protein
LSANGQPLKALKASRADGLSYTFEGAGSQMLFPSTAIPPKSRVTSSYAARMFGFFQPADRFPISTAITIFFLFYSVIIVLPGSSLLNDSDTLWHIRTGQWILHNSKFPVIDFYSYTAAGTRWIAAEWLSEVLLALAFKIGHWRGVVILSAVMIAAIIATLSLYLLRNLRFSVAIGWTILTAFAISPHYLARPHLFSFLLLLVWLIILINAYDRGDFKPPVFVLVILMALWANLHGSFTLGAALLCIFAGYFCCEKFVQRVYSRCRSTFVMLLAVGVGALLTPYGIFSALWTLDLFNMTFPFQRIEEWRSPDFQVYQPLLFLFVGLFGIIAGLGIRLRGPRLIVFSIMLLLGLAHIRGLFLFFLVAPVIFARPIAERSVWWRSMRLTKANSSAGAGELDPIPRYFQKRPIVVPTICLAVAVLATVSSWRYTNDGPPESVAPKGAIDFVRQNGISGNVFNSFDFGGYLIFSGIPTFIDGRTPPYTDDFLWKHAEAVNLVDINKAFRLLDDFKVSWVILRPAEPMAKALARSALWNEVYADKYSEVFVRR